MKKGCPVTPPRALSPDKMNAGLRGGRLKALLLGLLLVALPEGGLRLVPMLAPPPVAMPAAATRQVAPWTEMSGPSSMLMHRREQWQHPRRRVQEIGESLQPSGSVRPVAAVQQRILARLRGAELGPSSA